MCMWREGKTTGVKSQTDRPFTRREKVEYIGIATKKYVCVYGCGSLWCSSLLIAETVSGYSIQRGAWKECAVNRWNRGQRADEF